MKHPGKLMLVLALLSLPLQAADRAPVVRSNPQRAQLTAAQILQSGTLGKVLLGYYSTQQIQQGVYIGAEFCLACHPQYV